MQENSISSNPVLFALDETINPANRKIDFRKRIEE
jgi:hypothetical protein